MPWRACKRRWHERRRPQARAGLTPQLARGSAAQSASLDDPVAWAERIAGLTLDPWQRDVLLSAVPGSYGRWMFRVLQCSGPQSGHTVLVRITPPRYQRKSAAALRPSPAILAQAARRGCKAPNINGFILRSRPQRSDPRSHTRLFASREESRRRSRGSSGRRNAARRQAAPAAASLDRRGGRASAPG